MSVFASLCRSLPRGSLTNVDGIVTEAFQVRPLYQQKTLLTFLFLLMFSPLSFTQAPAGENRPAPTPSAPDAKTPEDISRWPGFLVAYEGGGGLFSSSNSGPTAYAGFKFGGTGTTFDLGYDRIPAHCGFSAEFSGMLPVFRFPRPQSNEMKKYLRVYAEPGLGYRFGGGVGTYASAKVMMVLFSDHQLTSSRAPWVPFIEVQRRFALQPDQHGDFRIMVGIISAICEHCGVD